ncbi:MAG: RNA-binding S4 domain-containing protein [Paracoccaceae bacterium]
MADTLRLDKWLWHARFFKTRTLAAKFVSTGGVRLNSNRVDKPAIQVKPGDGLSFALGMQVRVVRIIALGTRRGPAPEAQALYDDLTPELPEPAKRVGARPTKKQRRDMDAFRDAAALTGLEIDPSDD